MCQLCNETLATAAQAASLLARAAKDLYSINQQVEATLLAKAAADLFTEPKVSGETGQMPFGKGETAGPVKKPDQAKDAAEKAEPAFELPKGFDIDEKTGIVSINGVAIGRAVLVRRPTKH